MTRTLTRVDYISYEERIDHPLYGRLKVVYISKTKKGEGRALCELLDFKGTLKEFSTVDLSRIKFKHFEPTIIKGQEDE